MKRALFVALAVAVVGSAHAQSLSVVPNANAAVGGAFGLSTPISSGERTLQMIISSSQLTSMVNGQLTGLTFRLDGPEVASKPLAPISFTNYDIFLGQAAVAPQFASPTFANNYVPGTKTQLRSGALSLAASYFPDTAPNPNDFAAIIAFNLGGYVYTGGDLVLELAHSGNNTTDFALDAVENDSNYVAHGAAGYNAPTSTDINSVTSGLTTFVLAPVVQLQFTAAPEPGTLALIGLGALALHVRRRKAA